MKDNLDELFDEEIIGEEARKEAAEENLKKESNESIEEQTEDNKYEERVVKTESEELPQYDEVYENDIFVYDDAKDEEQKTEKKSFLSSVSHKKEHYVDYKTRLLGNAFMFVILLTITIIFFLGTFSKTVYQMINYNERSNLDYKVYLKENNFYETNYLGKNKVYIANLIDNIEVDFRYNYNIEKPSDVDFNYSIVAKLTIADGSAKNNYFEKEYVLLNNKRHKVSSGTTYNLNEKINIDYAYYNNLANSFKQQFGLDTTSNLTVYLKVNKHTEIENANNTVENSTMFVKIPLSEKAINIELNYQDINNSNYVIQGVDTKVDNVIFGVLATITAIVTLVFAIKTIRLLILLKGKKSIYDKYVGKILNEYDRLIVENSTGPDTKNMNVVKISKFEELLDVRDNLKLPIMYYVVTQHTKCYFYIKHKYDLYLLTIKAVDLEQVQEENK